jgi:hypothetical protein
LSEEGSPARRARQSAARTARRARLLASIRGTGLLPSGLPAPARLYTLPAGSVVAVPATGQKLYRMVKPTIETADFVSRAAKGCRPYTAEVPILHVGISMFAEPAQAASRFGRSKVPGEVTLEEGQGFHIAKTLGNGHYTVWGDPDALAERTSLIDWE